MQISNQEVKRTHEAPEAKESACKLQVPSFYGSALKDESSLKQIINSP
jgi:hypothetical protein